MNCNKLFRRIPLKYNTCGWNKIQDRQHIDKAGSNADKNFAFDSLPAICKFQMLTFYFFEA
jgi:hypothetical protein